MDNHPEPGSTVVLKKFLSDPKNKTAFGEFAAKYGPRIYARCRSLGLQDVDAEDLAATILLRFFERETFKDFVFEGKDKFDRWLRKTVKNLVLDFLRNRARKPDFWSVGNPDAQELLDQVANEMAGDLSSAFEHKRALVQIARKQVADRVDPKTWQTFQLLVDDELPVAEVVKRFGIKDVTAWKTRSRVLQMLRDEVARLEEE
jgi:RNA polymerase sigma factor (sigma-70 family)